MFSKKIGGKRGIMTSLYISRKNEGYFKRNYMREGKEKYNMINTVVYDLNDLTYLLISAPEIKAGGCFLNNFR